MNITTELYKQVNSLLNEVDFDKIHTVMEKLNWTWNSIDDKIPDALNLYIVARDLLYDAIENGSAATGGFYAECIEEEDDKAELSLKFCVEDICNETSEECDD